MVKKVAVVIMLNVVIFANVLSGSEEVGGMLSTTEVVQASEIVETTEIEDSKKLPTLEEVLYHRWTITTDDEFVHNTDEETVSETMLAGADVYTVDSVEYDENDNLVIYWHTDYMTARLIAYANRDYKYMEANYLIEDLTNYDSDTLYFKR